MKVRRFQILEMFKKNHINLILMDLFLERYRKDLSLVLFPSFCTQYIHVYIHFVHIIYTLQ